MPSRRKQNTIQSAHNLPTISQITHKNRQKYHGDISQASWLAETTIVQVRHLFSSSFLIVM